MQEEQLKNLVVAWRGKSHNGNDPFVQFFYIWMCLNAWLEYSSAKETDRCMIEELKECKQNMRSLFTAYDAAVVATNDDGLMKRSIAALVNMSQELPIKDTRKNPKHRREPVRIRNESDFKNIVEVLYRIRCTLFHKGKDADDPRERALVNNAKTVLQQWIYRLTVSW